MGVGVCCSVLQNTRQHTATHGNALQRTATHGNTRQHTVIYSYSFDILLEARVNDNIGAVLQRVERVLDRALRMVVAP